MIRFILIAIFLPAFASAQNDTALQVLLHLNETVHYASVDNLDNVYLVSASGHIKKLDARGDSVAVYNQQKKYGELTDIDVSNPLKPVLFYKDFSTVVVLDRWLAEQATIDLRGSGILQPAAVGLSHDNQLWVFDSWDNKLKKIDEQGKLLLETTDLRTLFSTAISPQQILRDNGLVYLVDSLHGVYVFDIYGTFKKKLPAPPSSSVGVYNNLIFYTTPSVVVIEDPASFRRKEITLPISSVIYVHAQTVLNRLLLWNEKEVMIYRFRY